MSSFTPRASTVGRYRRRPEYVRAIRWTGDNWPAVEAFCGSGIDRREGDAIWLATVHGRERCDLGDWIIEGVEDFYPNRHNVFIAIYQALRVLPKLGPARPDSISRSRHPAR